jgi:hypothetical protein
MSEVEYYRKELERIKFNEFSPMIKVTGEKGSETRWLNLNVDSIKALREFLDVVEERIQND